MSPFSYLLILSLELKENYKNKVTIFKHKHKHKHDFFFCGYFGGITQIYACEYAIIPIKALHTYTRVMVELFDLESVYPADLEFISLNFLIWLRNFVHVN